MNYWLVRTKFGIENKKSEFINNDEWVNFYDDKYLEIVKRVETEDILLLAEDSSITHYGECTDNPKDGKHLTVDKWIMLQEPIYFLAKGSYIKAIVQINNDSLIKEATLAIENTNSSHDIKINSISINNFTVFKNENLYFFDYLNIILGENGVGKSHLIKLLYSLIMSINESVDSYNSYDYESMYECMSPLITDPITDLIDSYLMDNFKTDYLTNLISYNKEESFIDINLCKYNISFYISDYSTININIDCIKNLPKKIFRKNCIFIPAKEILSFYEGFIPLYENRETSFDEVYYDLAKALSLPALKNIESHPEEYKLFVKLEEILEGKILLERGRFYLLSDKNKQKTEITLIAEGLRKIGMIAQLLANGSLTKNSILFWDEPETNLNPRLIRKMAEVLIELSRLGMQIFVATHSLFLVKEIEILRNKQDKVKYFSLGFDENKEIRVSQSEEFEYLEDIVLLDEELEQDNRFLAKEENE